MKGTKLVFLVIILLAGALVAAAPGRAGVGRFLQVQGQVDLLKQGQLPAQKVEAYDEVDIGDIVRTKSASKAQIQFVDDTVLTIGPESRVVIEKYLFDADQGERQAVLRVFMGLVKTVVNQVYETEEPDFIMKTHTAVMGVRGTKWLAYLLPNRTDIYVYEVCSRTEPRRRERCGLEVRSAFPEIEGLVVLKDRQYTQVEFDQPPTPPVHFTPEDVKPLEDLLELKAEASAFPLDAPPVSFQYPGGQGAGENQPPFAGGLPGETDQVRNPTGGLYVPPQVPGPSLPEGPAVTPGPLPGSPGQIVGPPAEYYKSGSTLPSYGGPLR
ncbi:MAG: FecR domain-containing protein [Deltaproteobacteria bacterium]|nr:FecR domain-containing protein [Deltaproteobacteria bacterium]